MSGEAGTDPRITSITTRVSSKSDHVRQVFENAPRYLRSRGVDIRFRVETVQTFAQKLTWHRLLDIGCGDGSISLQLLTPTSKLTLLDLSASMVALARSNVPEEMSKNVTILNGNVMTEELDPEQFDLVITVGVMAHVDSPGAFLAKIRSLLQLDGSLIIEFTDSRHFVGLLGRFWGKLKEIVAPPLYSTNRLSFSDVAPLFESNHLRLVSVFRYSRIPLPGIDRVMSHKMQHKVAQMIFGSCADNRNAWLGNEYICLLRAV